MNPIAILASDIHFSANPPIARSAEPNWFFAMLRSIVELKKIVESTSAPLIIAGDYFDKYNAAPELINFVLDNFPHSYGIVGQHDIAYHRYDLRNKSAFGTLVRAGKITELEPNKPNWISNKLIIHTFPWGFPVTPFQGNTEGYIHLAVIHSYIYRIGAGNYPGVPKTSHADMWGSRLAGYDAAHFGDNHKTIISGRVFNPGTFFCRKSDEREHRPLVGLLYEDGHVEPYYLDVSQDKWLDGPAVKTKEEQTCDTSGFILSLDKLSSDSLDFRQIVNQRMDEKKVDGDVRKMVLDAIA